MSESPVIKKLKLDDTTDGMNGDTVVTTITNGDSDCVEKKENNSNNHQIDTTNSDDKVDEGSNGSAPIPQEMMNTTPPAAPVAPPVGVIEALQSSSPPAPMETAVPVIPPAQGIEAVAASPPVSAPTAPTAQTNNRIDPNEIIAQLKESLRQEEAKLQFLRKLKMTQAKLKERQEKFASPGSGGVQTKDESREGTPPVSAIPPPPPLLKPTGNNIAANNNNNNNNSSPGNTKPYSVIVSNSSASSQGNIKPKTDPASLASSLQSIASIPAPTIQSSSGGSLGRSTVQPNRAAMAKILEEMILQQPSPKPKVLQWPICPNINDQEYLLYTGLEFIVGRLKGGPKQAKVVNPSVDISCRECGLDFSPEWEKTDTDEKFECYYCFTSKLRKQVREEHTERLKQGFIKVVQKEKEFERQLQVQQREEQLLQQKLAEQQRQQQQQIIEQQQRTLQLQLQQQTLEQLQRQQIANQLLQHLQKSRTQPNSSTNALSSLLQDPANQLLAQLQKRSQQNNSAASVLAGATSAAEAQEKDHTAGQLRDYLLDLLPRLPSQ